MSDKNPTFKVPPIHLIILPIFLIAVSFFAGYKYNQLKLTTKAVEKPKATASFTPKKSDKPLVKFFVMSFCPYGNQMEDTLKPIVDLLGNKVEYQPQYIFNKIDNLDTFCKSTAGDVNQCALYVQNKYFKDESECKKTVTDNNKTCLDEKAYIKSASGAYYASLHGRQEANQNIREICAWNQNTDKKNWWTFVENVNKNCTSQNADICWESEAKKANLDTTKITECFNTQAIDLIEKEIVQSTKYNVSGSPTVLINDVNFPPQTAYTQDGTGTLQIGNKTADQTKYRTPNVVKEAICTSFGRSPKECNTLLPELSGAQPGLGGCGK